MFLGLKIFIKLQVSVSTMTSASVEHSSAARSHMYYKVPPMSSLWGSSNANTIMESVKVFPKVCLPKFPKYFLCATGIPAMGDQ